MRVLIAGGTASARVPARRRAHRGGPQPPSLTDRRRRPGVGSCSRTHASLIGYHLAEEVASVTTNARVPPSLEGVLAMSDATCAELREVCVRAGYTEATIAIVSSVPRTVQGAPVPLLRRALLGGS